MAHDKVQTVLEWAEPKNVKHVHSFLGFASIYQRFIEGLSRIAKPLTDFLIDNGRNFV